jgi:hypothetical protein
MPSKKEQAPRNALGGEGGRESDLDLVVERRFLIVIRDRRSALGHILLLRTAAVDGLTEERKLRERRAPPWNTEW